MKTSRDSPHLSISLVFAFVILRMLVIPTPDVSIHCIYFCWIQMLSTRHWWCFCWSCIKWVKPRLISQDLLSQIIQCLLAHQQWHKLVDVKPRNKERALLYNKLFLFSTPCMYVCMYACMHVYTQVHLKNVEYHENGQYFVTHFRKWNPYII